MRNRPIGIGIQGLADAYIRMRIPFESDKAYQVNQRIFESIYYGAVKSSINQAKEFGHYESYPGSPASEGKLQFDLWNHECNNGLDWDTVKKDLKTYGLRNSLLVAPMPTASTS